MSRRVHMRREEAGAFAASAEAQFAGHLTAFEGPSMAGHLRLHRRDSRYWFRVAVRGPRDYHGQNSIERKRENLEPKLARLRCSRLT